MSGLGLGLADFGLGLANFFWPRPRPWPRTLLASLTSLPYHHMTGRAHLHSFKTRNLLGSQIFSIVCWFYPPAVFTTLNLALIVFGLLVSPFVNFYQRVSIASYANRWYSQRTNVRPSVRLSVCSSQGHTPVLYQNEES